MYSPMPWIFSVRNTEKIWKYKIFPLSLHSLSNLKQMGDRMKKALYLISIGIVLVLTVGCTRHTVKKQSSEADSIYTWEHIRQSTYEQPEHALALIDTAVMKGLMDETEANFNRARIYYNANTFLPTYPQKARDYCQLVLDDHRCDSLQRLKALSLMTNICSVNTKDWEEDAIRYALEGVALAHHMGDIVKEADFYSQAGTLIERKQRGSGMTYLNRSLDIVREASKNDVNLLPGFSSNLGSMSRTLANAGDNAGAISLLEERLDVIDRIEKEIPTAPKGWADEQRALTYSVLAFCQHASDDKEGARRSAEAFHKTKASENPDKKMDILWYYSSVPDGLRIQEIYKEIEPKIRESHDTISDYYIALLRCYAYGLQAIGHYQQSSDVYQRLLTLNDSLEQRERQSETLKLAQMLRTQEKEMQISEQEAEIAYQRVIGLIAALILLTAFFIVYTWYRRKAERRLKQAHGELQSAYEQLEETTAAKERIESELRIARNIQMSMVPNVFPNNPGLDMYAFMNPAKEVGGDLYGYLLMGDQLYFCVGDVSGKGVPASLFMSQATRLFRTMAAQGMKPAEICTRMNDALTDGNTTRMFVTFFLGLVDLKTGHLDFCNGGHNAPVIVDAQGHADFIKMMPNLPIGIMPKFQYKGEMIDCVKGKSLFLYTDGLNEAENSEHQQFGNDRLLEALKAAGEVEARGLIELLVSEVEKHRDGAEPNDDLTMMYLTIK